MGVATAQAIADGESPGEVYRPKPPPPPARRRRSPPWRRDGCRAAGRSDRRSNAPPTGGPSTARGAGLSLARHGAPPPDRRVRRWRVLDGARQPPPRRPRARPDRRRAPARLLPADRLGRRRPLRRALLSRLLVRALRAVARL